jgi:hypothetical protein
MAPRISSRSERLFGRLSVIEGNMCSEIYAAGRTEISGTSGIAATPDTDPTAEREIPDPRLQPILQGPGDDAGGARR